MFRQLSPLASSKACPAAARVVTMLMEESDQVWAGEAPLLQMPAYKNLTCKLLLVGRLLRVTPDDVERKLIALEEISTLKQALGAAQKAEAANQVLSISSKLEKLNAEFYQMETACAPANVQLCEDSRSSKLLIELRDHLELLKQEELGLRSSFRNNCADKDRPCVDLKDLSGVLEQCARALSLGDYLQDSQDMFSELFYLKGEKKRAFSLPEFLDVLGKWMELYGLFRKHDRFKKGFITVNDMVESMEEFGCLFGYKPTPFHVIQLCNEFDIDKEFGVTWEEFRLIMHRWIEEKKKGEDIGKGAHQVTAMVTQDVLQPSTVQELRTLFGKFAKPNGTFDVLELGSLFEEICYSFNLGGTLSDLFRLFRAVESASEIAWPQFVSIMGKWIILKQLFCNYSKDGGHTLLVDDLEYPLSDLKDMWGCFDPRHGNNDLSVMAKEVAASVNSPKMTFEEFVNAMRFQVAFKVIFELFDPDNTGALPYTQVMKALRIVEDYCGLPATFGKGLANVDQACMDTNVSLTWSEFLITSHVAVGDEFDGAY